MTGGPLSLDGLDISNADDMLAYAQTALTQWQAAGNGTAAERKAARSLAFAFGRLNMLAKDGQLPAEWVRASVIAAMECGRRGNH